MVAAMITGHSEQISDHYRRPMKMEFVKSLLPLRLKRKREQPDSDDEEPGVVEESPLKRARYFISHLIVNLSC